jgi:GDPmannose 4,6-dehydratase
VGEKGIVRSLSSTLTSSSAFPNGASNLKPPTSNLRIGDVIIEIDSRYFRPLEVEFLQGDASKAREKLRWEPKVRFKELVRIMVDADIKNLEEMKQCQDVIRKLSNK